MSSESPRRSLNTGFNEPLSPHRNTMLPHKDAITAPGEELNTAVITDDKRRRHSRSVEAEMYKDLELVGTEHEAVRDGKLKRVIKKLTCTSTA